MAENPKTPGIFVTETGSNSTAVPEIATAVPAFIGYAPCAERYNEVRRIESFADFQALYTPAGPAKPYSPSYHLVAQKDDPKTGHRISIAGQLYSILPDPDTIYHLYNAMRLFYQNGGGTAYVVAVGPYGPPSGKPVPDPAQRAVNRNVKLADLQNGLALLKAQQEPTLYICPDAVMLPAGDNATFMQSALLQTSTLQSAICLFDVIGGLDPDPLHFMDDIAAFREGVGAGGLDYGAAYYPFVGTTVMQDGEIDFTNLFGGDVTQLLPLLNPPSAPNPQAAGIIATIQQPHPSVTDGQLNTALIGASRTYAAILSAVQDYASILPPCGAMAGIYTVNDDNVGVWNSPANIGIVGAISVPIHLSDDQQAPLNVDAVSGKSINAIRTFPGLGILVWGARTLDGNSQDWRYIAVRRTVIYIEQSIKAAMSPYVFAPNDADTWTTVHAMIDSFLTGLWKQGGLQGASAADAFSVAVGLGATMTAEDIANGILRVAVSVAIAHPAEFIVISIEQQQAVSA